ncbi:hypothetical protein FRC11_001482, partial [Ceratobasidium sp. 423]
VRYLARASSTSPLDIHIEIRSELWSQAEISSTDWRSQQEHMSDLLEFLKTIGAIPGRWRTLSIWAGQPEPLFEAIAFLGTQVAPMLRCLSLRWASKSIQQYEENRALSGTEISLRSLVLSGPSAPSLRDVEFTSISWPFILERPRPLFTGLTSLSLTAATRLCSITKLVKLLRGNPHLESLHLSSGPDNLDSSYFLYHQLHTPCVLLPSLRSLSVQSAYRSDWILDVLKAIQVPNLEKFTLVTELYADYLNGATESELRLLDYLSGGAPNGDVDGSSWGSETRSMYPLLRELDVSRVSCHSGGKTIETLLSSFASVTCLSIASHQTDCLGRLPWISPRLELLKLDGCPCWDLGNILRRRAASGYPIPMVELRGCQSWEREARNACISALPDSVTVVERPDPENVPDDDASDADCYENEDDAGPGAYFNTGDEWRDVGSDPEDNGSEDRDHEYYDQIEEEYEQSDGYNETGDDSDDPCLPARWAEEDVDPGNAYDSDESWDKYEGYSSDEG